MELRTVFPEVVFDKTMINFWECSIGDSKSVELKIKNLSPHLPVDYEFIKIPYFYVDYPVSVIEPDKEITVIITFIPKNYGRFTNVLKFKYINNLYEIGIKIFGKAMLKTNNETSLTTNTNNNTTNLNTSIGNATLTMYNTNTNFAEGASLGEIKEEGNSILKTDTNFAMNTTNQKFKNMALLTNMTQMKLTSNSIIPKNLLTTTSNFLKTQKNLTLKNFASSTSKTKKNKKKEKELWGPEAIDINFMRKPNLVNDEICMNYTLPSLKPNMSLKEKTEQLFLQRYKQLTDEKSNNAIIQNFVSNFEEYQKTLNHRIEANNYLKTRRKEREEAKKQQQEELDSTHADSSRNIGNFYLHGKLNLDMIGKRLESPKCEIPKINEGLWVSRPIGKYEPSEALDSLLSRPDFNDKQLPLKKPDKFPQSAIDKKDCEMVLDGNKLQRILVSSSSINFGNVFKASKEERTFWIKNTLRTSIYVELLKADDQEYFIDIDPPTFVVGPGNSEGSIITFSTHKLNLPNFTYLKYRINKKHQFKVKILFQVEYVKLECPVGSESGIVNKFTFQLPTTTDMVATQKIPLINNGNAPVLFKFEKGKTGHFKAIPEEGEVKVNEQFEIVIEFNPFESQLSIINDSLLCICQNDNPNKRLKIDVQSQIHAAKADFVNSNIVDFGDISVNVKESKTFYIKCDKGGPTAFLIYDYPSFISFSETKGIIDNRHKPIDVIIFCENDEPISRIVPIKVRCGGEPLKLFIKAKPMEALIESEPRTIDFGEHSFGEQDTRKITLSNRSNLSGYVVVDLRSPEFDCFKFRLSGDYKGKKNYLIKDLEADDEEDEEDLIDESYDDDMEDDNASFKEDGKGALDKDKQDENKNQVQVNTEEQKYSNIRYFQIEIRKNESLDFDLVFVPGNDATNKQHEVTLNINMKGATEPNLALQVVVFAKQKDSLITLNPREKVQFRKTYVGKSDKSQSTSYANLKLYCNHYNEQKFKIDMSRVDPAFTIEEVIENGRKRMFDENTKIGLFDGSNLEIVFRCSFTPIEDMSYKSVIEFIPFNEELNRYETKGKIINLIGEGAKPKITFDKREIILPIVPLGFESRTFLKLRNEGYGEMGLKHCFISDIGSVDHMLKAKWVSGNKIGILRNEIKLEISYKNKGEKVLSFTVFLEISDLDENKFPIYVHCTSDNCLLTNFNFYYLNKDKYYISATDQDKIMLDDIPKKDVTDLNKFDNDFYNNSKPEAERLKKQKELEKEKEKEKEREKLLLEKSYMTLNFNRNYKQVLLDRCKYLYSLLSHCLYASITSFPETLASQANKGEALLNLIENLSGKSPEIKIEKFEEEPTKRVMEMRNFFSKIIKYLQEQSALLNTVIPEYLLDYSSFKRYLKNDEYTKKVLNNNWEKTTKILYYYKFIHLESWITLVYQIFKVFYLSRVNIQSVIKSFSHLDEDTKKTIIPTIKNNFSNLYSSSELLLLKWLKWNYEISNFQIYNGILNNFSDQLKDGSIIYGVLASYIPNAEEQLKVNAKKKLINEIQSTKNNSLPEKVFNILKDYGVFTHFTVDKLINPTDDRETLIFILLLFQTLPFFIPKQIVFKCILNEYISQTILIHSHHKKTISYLVKKFGSSDFVVNKEIADFTINAGEPAYNYKITFKSRFKQEVKGKLFFINSRHGLFYQSCPLVYELVSNVTERKSLGDNIYFSGPLYEKTEYKIQLKSPFNFKGDFKILPPEIRRITNKSRKKIPSYMIGSKRKDEKEEFIPPVFLFKSADPNFSYRLDTESKFIFNYF